MQATQHQDPPKAGVEFYAHPDGHGLMFDATAQELRLFNADSFVSLAIPMGASMLAEVGERMAALGKKLQGSF